MDEFEWDPRKAGVNRRKHGIDFADACHSQRASAVPEERTMKAQRKGVDFSGGRRGAVLPPAKGKTRITIRLDTELLDWFREEVDRAGGGNYQTLINDALRQHVEGKRENLEDTLRRVLHEELARPRGPRG
jgi:uncharacterized protein (DUF4415 family)